jgi:hypothetical protein
MLSRQVYDEAAVGELVSSAVFDEETLIVKPGLDEALPATVASSIRPLLKVSVKLNLIREQKSSTPEKTATTALSPFSSPTNTSTRSRRSNPSPPKRVKIA